MFPWPAASAFTRRCGSGHECAGAFLDPLGQPNRGVDRRRHERRIGRADVSRCEDVGPHDTGGICPRRGNDRLGAARRRFRPLGPIRSAATGDRRRFSRRPIDGVGVVCLPSRNDRESRAQRRSPGAGGIRPPASATVDADHAERRWPASTSRKPRRARIAWQHLRRHWTYYKLAIVPEEALVELRRIGLQLFQLQAERTYMDGVLVRFDGFGEPLARSTLSWGATRVSSSKDKRQRSMAATDEKIRAAQALWELQFAILQEEEKRLVSALEESLRALVRHFPKSFSPA